MTILHSTGSLYKRLITLNKEQINIDEIKEEERIIELSKKDISCFEALYNKYYESIFRYVHRQTDDEDETADIVSRVFLNAIKALHKYENRGLPFGAWLFKIASNETNKFFRGQKNRLLSIETSKLNLIMECDQLEEDEDRLRVVNQLVNQLEDDEIKILELKFFESKNFKEIAFVLNKKESAVKMRMYRSLNKLKELFDAMSRNGMA